MKQTFNTLKIISLAIILSFGLSYAIAWTAPSATPPTGNVSAPINTGSATASQTITGKLTVTATTTTGSLLAGGSGLFANSLTTKEILFTDGTKQETAGGNFAAVKQYTSDTTLTVANDGGRLIELGGGGSYNLTLPVSSPGSGGKRISFVAYGGGPFYLVPQGSDCLWLTTKCVAYVTIASPGYAGITSNGTGAWIVDSGTPLDGSVGIGQTWQNVTTTRAFDVSYTNSTGKPIMVAITHSQGLMSMYVDGVLIGKDQGGNNNTTTFSTFVVPSGSTYSVSNQGAPLLIWTELR